MNIKGKYIDDEIVLRKKLYYFDIEKEEAINFNLKKAPYYHNTITIYNPLNERVGHFSFKSQNKNFYISEGIVTGRWRIEITDTMKFYGEFDIEITQGEKHPEAISLIHEKKNFTRKTNLKKRWYRGDFHMHTTFSDGYYPLEKMLDKCIQNNLEVVAITDHNVMHGNSVSESLLTLPSTELTLDDRGHFNLHGLEKELDFSKIIEGEKSIPNLIEKFLKKSRSENIVTCLNHPFADGTALLYDIRLDDLNLMEVIRSPFKGNNNTTNNMAIKALDYLWARGYRIYGVGGSDSHGSRNNIEESVGYPTTNLHLDGLSIKNTLSAMENGNTYLSVGTSIELDIIDNKGEKVLPGTAVEEGVTYEITGSEPLIWQTIIDGVVVDSKEGTSISTLLNLKEGQFGRVEARDSEGNIRVFINPNYRRSIKKIDTSWGEVRRFILGDKVQKTA